MRVRLFPALAAAFVLIPLLDMMTLLWIGQYLKFWPTLALVILSGTVGAHLARSQGIQVWRQMQLDMAEGRVPTQGLLDAVLILFAGGMMMAPGLLTDGAGLLLLLPPVRGLVKRLVRRKLESVLRNRVATGS